MRPFSRRACAWRTALLAVALVACGCRTVTWNRDAERAFLAGRDGPAIEAFGARAVQGGVDSALNSNLLGTAAMVAGDYRMARRALVEAGQIMGSFPANDARQIGALIGEESTKIYLGDPYEAAMNSLYTALVFLARGDEENARAALKQGILADSGSEEEEYQSDIVALYLLEALLARRAGKEEIARLDLEQVLAIDPENPFAEEGRLAGANSVILVDSGEGPEKVATGRYGELATFELPHLRDARAALFLDGVSMTPALGVDVAFQAITRGGREMDHILKGKAVIKEITEVAGALTLNRALRTKSSKKRGKLAAIAGGLLLISAATRPRADTRHWHLLPARSFLWIGRVPAGLHTLRIEMATEGGAPLPAYRQIWHHLPFDEEGLNVYYFRSGFHKGFRRLPSDHDEADAGKERT